MRPTQAKVRRALADIRGRLAETTAPELADRAELVLAEVLNNIVEHAFAERGAERGEVAVTLARISQGLRVTITDNGRAMAGGGLPSGAAPRVEGVPVQDLPEGGFGWLLIRRLTSDVAYCREGGRNHLSFRILD